MSWSSWQTWRWWTWWPGNRAITETDPIVCHVVLLSSIRQTWRWWTWWPGNRAITETDPIVCHVVLLSSIRQTWRWWTWWPGNRAITENNIYHCLPCGHRRRKNTVQKKIKGHRFCLGGRIYSIPYRASYWCIRPDSKGPIPAPSKTISLIWREGRLPL